MTRSHPVLTQRVARDDLLSAVSAELVRGQRLSLVAAHEDADTFRVVHVFLGASGERTELVVEVPRTDAWLPSLAGVDYQAGRYEREMRDLYGLVSRGHPQPFRLVRHGHWPTGYHPMLRDAVTPGFDADAAGFPFVEVAGQGVYEIPVGPVHAGLIEPGHFRFSVVGETILTMYQRLYFVHRGIEKLFEGRTPADAVVLAERISGDTAVGHGLAFTLAVEDALGLEVSERTALVRALLLEAERLHNHVNDLGAIVNDVGFGIVHQHCGRLRERLLRHNATLTGHRLLRGSIAPGRGELLAAPDVALIAEVAAEVAEIATLSTGHGMVANRLDGTAVLRRDQAERLGVLGYVARASGLARDARAEQPFVDLGPAFEVVTRTTGDVRARFEVRAEEFAVSARLIADLATRLDALVSGGTPSLEPRAGAGLGVVEAWRGTLVHRVEVDAAGRLTRVKVVDPSFCTWPALPVALADVIVPDFPLANKSFNMSYAGNDL